ncbi:hypothetical protein MUP01_14000 [Candidatus Bathyarchaeota archaeon]|nr:hypothetical protein [Candidatus Bathyarchaeota archaeon]
MQFRKEITERLETFEPEKLLIATKFINEMNERKKNKSITHDEMLTIVKAVVCEDEYCRKVIQEVQQKNALEFDLEKAISEFLNSKQLPKTNPSERLQTLKIGQETILDRKRMLITQAEGLDPDPVFLGKSEDGRESIYETYVKCRNKQCGKVFKSFKNEMFDSPNCREQWVKENQNDRPLVQEEFSELNSESWEWERIGSKSDSELGVYGVFRRVFKND